MHLLANPRNWRLVPDFHPSCPGAMVTIAAPSCLLQRHFLQLSTTLAERCQQLQLELSDQVASLPFGNERWLLTERELSAAEDALLRLQNRVELHC